MAKNRLVSRLTHDLRSVDEAELIPFADRYRGLMDRPGYDLALLSSAGRFGFDPLDILQEAYVPGARVREYVMRGICYSAPRWHEGLLPLVREMIREEVIARARGRLDEVPEELLRFLVYMGQIDEARDILRSSDWTDTDFIFERGFLRPNAPAIPVNRIC